LSVEVVGRRDLGAARRLTTRLLVTSRSSGRHMGAGAVDVDIEARIVGDCWIERPRCGIRRIRFSSCCIGEIRSDVGAADLQVDRRRSAEFRIWLTYRPAGTRTSAGKARAAARGVPERNRWSAGAFPELDLDIAVLRADHAGVV